jgi:ComF family protein
MRKSIMLRSLRGIAKQVMADRYPRLRWLGRAVVDLVFPPRCVCCDAELPADAAAAGLVCQTCYHRLGPEVWVGCRRCGAELRDGGPSADCAACRASRLKFDAVCPLGAYEGLLRDVVIKTKRPSQDAAALALGRLLAQRRGDALASFAPSVIVPIPMHWWRRLRRGANSPEILAQCLSRRLGAPVAPRALVRRRYTLPQRDLTPRQRAVNVRGAFRVRHPNRQPWRGSHVLLVDDILTTGATCSEAARVFKEAGAAAVVVAVVARA